MKMVWRCCLLILAGTLGWSCGQYQWVATAPRPLDAMAKSFSVSPHKANIYVVCVSKPWWRGGAGFVDVFLNETRVGTLDSAKYRLLIVPPGQYAVGHGWATKVDGAVTLAAGPGKNYFVRISERTGKGRPGVWRTIEILPEAEGQKLVRQAQLADKVRAVPF